MKRSLACSVSLLLVAPSMAAAQHAAAGTGTVVGVVRDDADAALPGAAITVTAGGMEVTSVTNPQGRYVLTGLPAKSFTIRATLAGFCGTEKVVSLEPGGSITADFDLHPRKLSTFIDWIAPPGSLSDLVVKAQTVAHVRVTAAQPAGECGRFAHILATVIDQVKPANAPSASLAFLQEQWSSEPTPYVVGTELVVLLVEWQGKRIRAHGPHAVFLVEHGTIVTSQFSAYPRYAGMPVEDLLRELRQMQ